MNEQAATDYEESRGRYDYLSGQLGDLNDAQAQLNDAIKELRGATPVRVKLVNDALQYLDNLAKQAKPDAVLQRELAAAYEKVGDMQDSGGSAPSVGDITGAVTSYRKALALREQLVAGNREDPSLVVDLALNYRNFARLLWNNNDIAAGFEMATKSLALRKQLADAQPENLSARPWPASLTC